MAQVISEQTSTQQITISRVWWQVLAVGAAVGVVQWVLAFLIGQYIIEPLYCQLTVHASICLNSVGISGNIAAVIVAVLATGVLVRLRVVQPLVITIASLALLWDCATWTDGLVWGEGIAWTILLYIFSYLLFSWIARYERITPVLVMTTFVVLIGRTLLIL